MICALGSGGTCAGLLAGCKAFGVPSRVVGVRVTDAWMVSKPLIAWLANRALQVASGESASKNKRTTPSDLHVVHDQFGGGYGVATDEAREAQALFERDGITLDLTYTAKAAAGLVQMARQASPPAPLSVLAHAFEYTADRPASRQAHEQPTCPACNSVPSCSRRSGVRPRRRHPPIRVSRNPTQPSRKVTNSARMQWRIRWHARCSSPGRRSANHEATVSHSHVASGHPAGPGARRAGCHGTRRRRAQRGMARRGDGLGADLGHDQLTTSSVPMGHVRGFVLDNGAIVFLHGHGDALAQQLSPGQSVRIEGTAPATTPHVIHHATVFDANGNVLSRAARARAATWRRASRRIPTAGRCTAPRARASRTAAATQHQRRRSDRDPGTPRRRPRISLLADGTSVFLGHPLAHGSFVSAEFAPAKRFRSRGAVGQSAYGAGLFAEQLTFADGTSLSAPAPAAPSAP